jgi:hypothetical protein
VDDQRITGQYSQPLAERRMNRWLTATGIGVIKARQVVMNQRGTVQQLNCDGGCGQQPGRLDPTGEPDCQTEARAHAGPTGEYSMVHSRGQTRGRLILALHRPIERTMKGILDPEVWIKSNRFRCWHHRASPLKRRAFLSWTQST